MEVNQGISSLQVRVIDQNGIDLGIMTKSQALNIAENSGPLDLVKVAANANPPVCRIMDYGKFCFEKAKKEKEMRKNQRTVDLKEIRLTVNIGKNDMEIKAAKAAEFIRNGSRVKVLIRFRGREQGHAEIGLDVLKNFFDSCSQACDGAVVMEKPPQQETRNMFMFLAPNAKFKKAGSSRTANVPAGDVQSGDINEPEQSNNGVQIN